MTEKKNYYEAKEELLELKSLLEKHFPRVPIVSLIDSGESLMLNMHFCGYSSTNSHRIHYDNAESEQSKTFKNKEDMKRFLKHIDDETKEKFEEFEKAHRESARLSKERHI